MGEMLVLRHPPFNQPPDTIVADAEGLDRSEALNLVRRDRGTQTWTNQSESLFNASDFAGMRVMLSDGSADGLSTSVKNLR